MKENYKEDAGGEDGAPGVGTILNKGAGGGKQ